MPVSASNLNVRNAPCDSVKFEVTFGARGGAGDLRVAGESSGQPPVAEQQGVELRDIDVFGVHPKRRIGARR